MSNSIERRIDRMLESFNVNLQGRPIEEYFNIDLKFRFKLKKNENKEKSCLFSFKYEEQPFIYNICNLPQDINRYIKTYIKVKYVVHFELLFPNDYPFKPPEWLIHTPINHIELHKQLNFIIKTHNYKYIQDWAPWIMIEKDVLFMIEHLVKINYSKL